MMGGIVLTNPTSVADVEFPITSKISNPLNNSILQQNFEYPGEVVYEQGKVKGKVRRMKCEQYTQAAVSLK